MARNIVAVDIGSTSVRAVEVSGSKSQPTLVRFLEIALPEGAVSRGEVIEAHTVGGIIKRIWSTGGFKSKNIVLGMGNQRVLARDLTVPRASLAQIREALPFQVQDLLPVPVSEALLDFYPISESMTDSGPVAHGLLIAAIKDAVLGNVKAAQQAGLNPLNVDLIPFALCRILIRRPKLNGTTVLIDVGANATSVVIAIDGVPQFVRIIPAGGDDLTHALKLKLEIDTAEAEALKRRLGLASKVATEQERSAVETIYDVTGELLASLRNTISYFMSLRAQEPISRILVTGGGAQLLGLSEALAEMTQLPVIAADPFTTIAVSHNLDKDEVHRSRTSLTVALGLALGGMA
jgi:type IV pilus assembly protein PilM